MLVRLPFGGIMITPAVSPASIKMQALDGSMGLPAFVLFESLDRSEYLPGICEIDVGRSQQLFPGDVPSGQVWIRLERSMHDFRIGAALEVIERLLQATFRLAAPRHTMFEQNSIQ
jgi:hypothetical protein